MKLFRADMHIHTVLSPCGDLDMSPVNIVSEAALKGLDIIGITDHNSTRHCSLIRRLAAEKGIFVLQGAEVTTKEEVHCLAFFENTDTLGLFQAFLDSNLPNIPNHPEIFGHQVQVDENDLIVYEEKKLLINALSKSMKEVEVFVHDLGGIFIPAHLDRMKNSIYSQLGFLPENLVADAIEISRATPVEEFAAKHPEILKFSIVSNSDAHFPQDIGKATSHFLMNEPSFAEIKLALGCSDGRKITTE